MLETIDIEYEEKKQALPGKALTFRLNDEEDVDRALGRSVSRAVAALADAA
jgi:hypothetical protein